MKFPSLSLLRFGWPAAFGIAFFLGLGTPLSVAQEIEEITVTALKRDTLLQDVPASITAFTQKQIEEAGIQRAADFILMTPGVTMVNAAEYGDTQVNIRGLNGTRDAETNFALVVDGVLLTNPNAFNQELVDVQQIEILKGPQGALYGRNALAGAILINTRKPSEERNIKLRAGGGNNDSTLFQGVFSGPLGNNFYARLSLSSRDTDGHYTNDFINKDNVDSLEDRDADLRLVWEPSDTLSFDMRLGYSETEAPAISFNASVHLLDAVAAGFSPAFNENVNRHDFFYRHNIESENEQENINFSVKADWEISWGTLTGIISWNDQENYLLADGASSAFGLYFGDPACQASYNDRTPLPAPFFYGDISDADQSNNGFLPPYSPTTCDGYQYQERSQEDFNLELRLSSPDDRQLRWIAGFSYNDIEREVVVAQGRDRGQGIIVRPYNPVDSISPTDLLYHDEFTNQVYAVFGQVAYDLQDNLELAVAVRYDREEREVDNQVPRVLSSRSTEDVPDYINPAYNRDPNLTSIPARDEDFSQFQPKVSLTWQYSEALSLYGSYGIGFRSGGFNSQGTMATIEAFYRGLTNPFTQELFDLQVFGVSDDYEKEVSESVEVGFKSRLQGGRWAINGAIYRTDVEDMQFFNFFVGPFGLLRTVTNIDEVSIQGLELDVTFLVDDYLSVYAAVSLLDGEIEDNNTRPYTEGNEVPFAPEATYNAGFVFTVPLFADVETTGRIDWSYVGDTWFGTVQDDILDNQFTAFGFGRGDFSSAERDAYSTLNARLTFRSGPWSVALWGRNITDEDYLEEVIPAPEFGGSFIHDAAAAAYGIEFGWEL